MRGFDYSYLFLLCYLSLMLSLSIVLPTDLTNEDLSKPPTFSSLGQLKGVYAIYWGYFDPPTLAHADIIFQCLNELQVDKIIVVINSPKNSIKSHPTDINKRFQMMELLLEEYKDRVLLIVQDDEDRADYSTVKKQIDGSLYAVVGQDSYDNWARFEGDLSAYDSIVVVPREVAEPASVTASTPRPPPQTPPTTTDHAPTTFLPPNVKVLRIRDELFTVSSTKVRSCLLDGTGGGECEGSDGGPLRALVHPKVLNYVKQNALYRPAR